jgi:dsDNA-specific endonuclease/ATPase MutS2
MKSSEEEGLRRAAMEGLRIPFEFEKGTLNEVLGHWRKRQEEERVRRAERVEASLRQHLDLIDLIVSKVIELDRALAIGAAMRRYSLVVPGLGDHGEGFVGGRNPFLLRDSAEATDHEVHPVSYSLGRTMGFKVAKARNVAVLTGANSGGKTTLLTTLASVHILTLYGLPVPCESAEVVPIPIYLFRRRVTRRIGSLEHALGSLIPVFGDRRRKLVLIDEFEALTEPGAAGRIMAAVLNEAASSSSLVLVVTHLARETLPHVRLPIRVDGIEAKGLDSAGDLIVNRQPVFDHIGSSMPKLIIMKLSRSTKDRRVKGLYEEILASIKEERAQVQAPISTPWTKGDDE